MVFHYKPKEAIVQNFKSKVTGTIKRHLVCVFDTDGNLETDDPKVIYILQNKLPGVTWEGSKIESEVVSEILDNEEIRQLAKEKKLKSWHVKAIDTLRKELGELNEI